MAEKAGLRAKAQESKQKCSSFCKQNPEFNSSGSSADRVLQLQKTAGNQAVQRLIKSETLQAKLKIGQPDDIYEQEADRVAEQVMRMPDSISQSKCTKCNKSGKLLHSKTLPEKVPSARGQNLPPIVNEALQSPGKPLDAVTQAFMEPRFGYNFGQVRTHADSKSAKMAEVLNAEAFTVGNDIYFGAGKLQHQTTKSDQLLAHELAHVAQQSQMGLALQPKLKITGKEGDVSRAVTLLNSGLQGYRVSADKSGKISIFQNFVELKPNTQQKALADRLTRIINDPKDVIMTVSTGSKTIGGSFVTGDFDIADLETYGVAGLIHEIEEQYQKQVKGLAFGSETTGAHKEAITAESEVRGAKRGAQKIISSTTNADGTLNAVIEIPHTFPDGKVKTMIMTIKNNNIVSVKWS